MKKLFKILAMLTSFSVLTRTLGFLFRILLSRSIGAEGLGAYQIAFSIYMVLETFISSGLPLVISKITSVSVTSNNKKKEFSSVSAALIIGLITAIILCSVVLIFRNVFSLLFTDKRCLNILITLLPALVFSSVYSILRGNIWGHKKYFWVSLTEFVEQLIRAVFCVIIFAFFYTACDAVMVATLSMVVACVLSSVLVFIVYLKIGGKFYNPKGQFKPILKESVPITIVKIVSSLLMPIISIIIPLRLVSIGYTNEQALSIFGVAMGMTFPLLYIPSTLIGALSMTLIPDLSSALSTQNYTDINTRINFSMKFALFVAFLFAPVFYALGSPIGEFLYSNTQSGVFLTYASPLVIPICVTGITTSCLNALNLEVKSFRNYLISSVFLFFSIIFLTKSLGILSLVWGMGASLVMAIILNIRLLNKKLNSNFFNFSYLLKLFACSIPAVLISKFTYSLLSKFLPLFFSLGFSCVIAEIFFLLLALILNLYNLSFLNFKKLVPKKPSFSTKLFNKKLKNKKS